MHSCPPSPRWATHKISHVYRSLMVHLPDAPRLQRPQGPAQGPTSPARAATSTTPAGAAQYTARHPAARLAAAGRLPILGRLSAPGAFLRVPQEPPAKHQPDHYRRGEPGGQADQHPRPRAHPAPKRHIRDTGRALYPSHDQPCRCVTAERCGRARGISSSSAENGGSGPLAASPASATAGTSGRRGDAHPGPPGERMRGEGVCAGGPRWT